MKRAVIALFVLGLFLINTSLISMAQASATLTYYDGRWGYVFFYPLREMMTVDVPTKNLTSPGAYPYVFTLHEPTQVYLGIRHFLWAYNEEYSNHLTILVDNEPVLDAYSPRAACPNGWYPGGDGVQVIYLGMRSTGTHFITMTCNISDYYSVDWWTIMVISQSVSRRGTR
jgi:hypothetical protein